MDPRTDKMGRREISHIVHKMDMQAINRFWIQGNSNWEKLTVVAFIVISGKISKSSPFCMARNLRKKCYQVLRLMPVHGCQ